MPKLLIALGVTWAARIAFRYRGSFQRKHVVDLLEDLNVSQMRPLAVEMKARLSATASRVPSGARTWCCAMKRPHVLLYRSSIPLGRLLFALRSADRLVGERVTVQGWYRRGLKPYIEMSRVEARVSKSQLRDEHFALRQGRRQRPAGVRNIVERSYSRWIQLAASPPAPRRNHVAHGQHAVF